MPETRPTMRSTMPISEAWNDTVAFVGREGALLFPVAFALIALPAIVFQAAMPAVEPGVQPEAGAWMLLLLPFLIFTIIGTLTLSALALQGGLSVGEAIGHALRRLLPFLGAVALIGLIGMAIMVPLSIVSVLLGGSEKGAMLLLMPLTLIIFILVSVRLVFINPVAANEPAGPIAVIRRSWALTRGHFWKLFSFFTLLMLITVVVTLAVNAVAGILLTVTIGSPLENEVSKLIALIASGVVNTIVSVFTIVVVAKLYARVSVG